MLSLLRWFALIGASATLCTAQSAMPTPEELAAIGTAWETSQHASPDFSFYETPANFSSSLKPGMLLKVEDATNLTNYTVPMALSMSRIIYTTLDVHGAVLPASAYILWPYQALSDNDTLRYEIALWAHGTTGVFQPCAPSNYRSLQYHFMVPYLLANQGMAVVAPDYAGLGVGYFANGTRIHHPWATPPAQANDMAYAIVAARKAFPQYLKDDGPFLALGHSQGGRAAWGFAERQAEQPVSGYRGTVVFAPPADAVGLIEDAIKMPNTSWSFNAQAGLQQLAIDAVTAVYPAYNWSGLTPTTSNIFFNAFTPFNACLPTQDILFGGLPLDQYAQPGWYNHPLVQEWSNLTLVGNKRFAGPMLMIAGNKDGSDGIIPYDAPISPSVLSSVNGLCSLMEEGHWDQSLQLMAYNDMEHFSIIQASQNMWLRWVKERLNRARPPPRSGCDIGAMNAFRDGKDTAQAGSSPNFLVEWVNSTLQWQYSL